MGCAPPSRPESPPTTRSAGTTGLLFDLVSDEATSNNIHTQVASTFLLSKTGNAVSHNDRIVFNGVNNNGSNRSNNTNTGGNRSSNNNNNNIGSDNNNQNKKLLEIYKEFAPNENDREFRRNVLHVAMRQGASVEKVRELLSTKPRLATALDLHGYSPLHIALDRTLCIASTTTIPPTPPCTFSSSGNSTPTTTSSSSPVPLRGKSLATGSNSSSDGKKPSLSPVRSKGKALLLSSSPPSFPDIHTTTSARLSYNNTNDEAILCILKAYPKAAQIEDRDQGRLPLHLAMYYRHSIRVVRALLEAYPRAARMKNIDSYTPLHMGMWENAPVETIRAVLVEYPEAAQVKTNNGYTPLVLGLQHGVSIEVIYEFFKTFPRAMQLTDSVWNTPLHYAARYGTSVEVILAVLQAYKVSAGAKNLDSQTPLHFAVTRNAPLPAILAILEANLNAASIADRSKWTPLHLAMKHNLPVEAIISILGAYPSAAEMTDLQGHTPLHLGLKSGVDADAIMAVLSACPKAAKMKNVEQRTPLHRVIANKAPAGAIRAVMEAYPEALGMQDYLGLTPLHSGIRCYTQVWEEAATVSGDPLRRDSGTDYVPLVDEDARDDALQFIQMVLEAFPDAAKLTDHEGCTPLFDFVHNLHRGHDNQNRNNGRSLPNNGLLVDDKTETETAIVQNIFEAHPRAAETICASGGSPVSILVGECSKAKSLKRLFKNDTCRRLKILLAGIRDGRPLRTLCTSGNPVALQAFFSLFEESGALDLRDSNLVPTVNLNKDAFSGWTLLEILADFDTEDSSSIVLQIVKGQWAKLGARATTGNKSILENDPLLVVHHHYSKFIFESIEPVVDTVLTRVADRAKLSISSDPLQRWGREYGRFLQRYRIEQDPKHISETCVMVFGTESRVGSDGRSYEAKVALKFMCHEDSFRREIEKRRHTDAQFVVPIKACFARHACRDLDCSHVPDTEFGVDMEAELRTYTKIRLQSAKNHEMINLEYLIVMECGAGIDLHDFIGHQNIAGKDLLVVVSIAKEIARCLEFLNGTCGIIHGDVKARNFVARGVGLGFAAIDFDNASSIVDEKVAGKKRTSSGYLPPEQAAVEIYRRSQAARTGNSISIETLKKELQIALERNFFFEVNRLSRLCEQAQQQSEQPENPPNDIVPSSSYDMWCYGVLLYYLCTGMQLFNVDTREEVEDHDLFEIRDWNDGLKSAKLSRVQPGWPVRLLEDLLEKNAEDRPQDWQTVIHQLNQFGSDSPKEPASRRSSKTIAPRENGALFDRLMVFQSSPLAFIDRDSSLCPVPLLDFEREADTLNQSLQDAKTIGANIEVVFESATTDRFNAFFAQKLGRVMHLSCHGHKDYLALENGSGGMHPLTANDLSRFVKTGGGNLKVVVVSACHSLNTGNAFVKAGVPHVVCCRLSDQFNDVGAGVFAGNFYRALACQHSLKEAFIMAREAVRVSPVITDAKIEADKFILLPEKNEDDDYHDVDVFFAQEVPPRTALQVPSQCNLSMPIPRLPETFLGRELSMYKILEGLKKCDVVRVRGVAGVGKSSVVAAVCRYMLRRPKNFAADYFFWLPSTQEHGSEPSYKHLSRAVQMLSLGDNDIMKSTQYAECWRNIVNDSVDRRGYLVIETLRFESESSRRNLELFLRDLLEIATVKVVMIVQTDPGTATQVTRLHSRRDTSIEIGPLDFHTSGILFANHVQFVYPGTKKVMAVVLNPPRMTQLRRNFYEQQRELYERIGGGIPADIHARAAEMSEPEFKAMVKWWEQQ